MAAQPRVDPVDLPIYRLTASFPADERYGVVSQLRRAGVSVPTNIAEGSRRQHAREYARFLNMAEGSLAEVEYLLMLSRDLNYASADAVGSLLQEATEIFAMLVALRRRVERDA